MYNYRQNIMSDYINHRIANVNEQIKNLIEVYKEIKDDCKCHNQIEFAKVTYEVSDGIIATIQELIERQEKENKDVQKYFEKIKRALENKISKEIPNDVIKNEYVNIIPKCILDYILNTVQMPVQCIDNQNDEKEDDIIIDDDITKHIKKIQWRTHQIDAILALQQQGYKCGIIHHIMGSGKTFVMLHAIDAHYRTNKRNDVYVIVCDRQEVLRKMFFDGDKLDLKLIEFWKENDIIDLNNYNIIDCVNHKPKNIEFNNTRPNILVINNDYLQSLEKKEKIQWDKVAFVELDESHCVSGELFYKLLRKIKYTYGKSIIGFSATPLRDKADKKVCEIFSQCTNKAVKSKKINIISQYDLMTAISDGIVLPFTCEYVEIVRTKKGKIGSHNKQIAQKMFDDILPKLPYKKIVMWCKTKETMKDYYKFFEGIYAKHFKIYCTSSFDAELMTKGFNTNIDDFFK